MTPTKLACIDPGAGETATLALGRTPSQATEEHRAACMVCELERLSFESLDEHAVEPSPALRAWIRGIARGRSAPPPPRPRG